MLWKISCIINFLLGGDIREPLCSRVYRQPPSQWRSVYVHNIDAVAAWLWGDWQHCLHVHVRWFINHAPTPYRI